MALALLEEVGSPVAAPTPIRFGMLSPTTAEHVRDQLGDQVDVILDGGPCCGRRRVDDRVVLRGSAHAAASRRNRRRGPGSSARSAGVSAAARTRAAGSGQTAAALCAAHAAGALLGSARRSGRPTRGTAVLTRPPDAGRFAAVEVLVGSGRLDSSRRQLVCRPATSRRARLGPDCRPAGSGQADWEPRSWIGCEKPVRRRSMQVRWHG